MANIEDYQDEINREYYKEFLAQYNNAKGNKEGTDCPICHNKGYMLTGITADGPIYKTCQCMNGRNAELRAQESGLGDRLSKCRFTTYKRNTMWQVQIYDMAYKSQYGGNGFFIGGKSGSGKTHICVALMQSMMDKGRQCRYVGWQDLATSLKQNEYGNSDEYVDTMEKIKTADVLFIDDLYRTNVTDADRRMLFSIIDYRYNQVEGGKKLFTIISSEKFLDEIKKIDEAIGRRIEALTEGYAVNVPREERYKYKR